MFCTIINDQKLRTKLDIGMWWKFCSDCLLLCALGWRDQCQLLYHKWCCVWSSLWNSESYGTRRCSREAQLDSVNIRFYSCSYFNCQRLWQCIINLINWTWDMKCIEYLNFSVVIFCAMSELAYLQLNLQISALYEIDCFQ